MKVLKFADLLDREDIYTIVYDRKEKQYGIRCAKCRLTSWNLRDVESRYCGKCNVFHESKLWV